jgi:3-phenylpropionate/trans-cinnamate dioxygenase ferredoxin reductase component
MTLRRIVVVGAGVAGLTAVRTLRDEGFSGEIVLLGDEAHVPYARPPLSKEALKRGPAIDDIALLPMVELRRREVRLLLGTRALALDVDGRRVVTSQDALD